MVKQMMTYNEYLNVMMFSNIFKLENTLIKSVDDDLYVKNDINNLFEIKILKKQKKFKGVVENNLIKIDENYGRLINVNKLEINLADGVVEIDVVGSDINGNEINLEGLNMDLDGIECIVEGEFFCLDK